MKPNFGLQVRAGETFVRGVLAEDRLRKDVTKKAQDFDIMIYAVGVEGYRRCSPGLSFALDATGSTT
jgi:hypothetical protein